MSEFRSGPWDIAMQEKYPFGYKITSADGSTIVAQSACSHSTQQKTLQDCLDGVGFEWKNKKYPAFNRQNMIDAVTEQIANARLMAAAPQLLEALREFMAIWGSGDSNKDSKRAQKRRADMWEKANAAIAKVEGAPYLPKANVTDRGE